MKIAVLALGSLATDLAPRLDGPLLPLEFTWTNSPPRERLILVLCDHPWVRKVRTPWVVSPFDDFDQALRDLAQRETVDLQNDIGYLKLNGDNASEHRFNTLHGHENEALNQLTQWGVRNHCSAVIWRDRPADVNFQADAIHTEAENAVIGHLQGDAATAAASYVRRVPMQVWTVIRERIAVARDWMPETSETAITTADELRFKDWQECRTTIGRLDTILEDLRKVGFSLITGLLTASAFLNFLGVPTASGVPVSPSNVRAAVFIAVMVLVAALFSVDTYYEVLLSGAVERALDLEAQTNPAIRVTKYLSINGTNSGISYIILALYLVLLATAESLGLLAAGWSNPGSFILTIGSWLWVLIVGLVILVLDVVLVKLAYVRSDTKPDLRPMVAAGVVLPVLTIGLAIYLQRSTAADPLGVWHWIATAGMFLALYIEFYWVYAAWRSGLYRQKQARRWPERTSDKIPDPYGPVSP